MINKKTNLVSGLTLIEVVITLLIIGVMAGAIVMTMSGQLPRYRLSRGIRLFYNHIISVKSRAVSLTKTYRLNVVDEKNFKFQYREGANWIDEGPVYTLPSDVEVSQSPFDYIANSGTNLEFTSRGMLNILSGAQTVPFLALVNTQSNEMKEIEVNIGGNIKIVTP